jgi:hypothetical protein
MRCKSKTNELECCYCYKGKTIRGAMQKLASKLIKEYETENNTEFKTGEYTVICTNIEPIQYYKYEVTKNQLAQPITLNNITYTHVNKCSLIDVGTPF